MAPEQSDNAGKSMEVFLEQLKDTKTDKQRNKHTLQTDTISRSKGSTGRLHPLDNIKIHWNLGQNTESA